MMSDIPIYTNDIHDIFDYLTDNFKINFGFKEI